jgi:hypothetical protein
VEGFEKYITVGMLLAVGLLAGFVIGVEYNSYYWLKYFGDGIGSGFETVAAAISNWQTVTTKPAKTTVLPKGKAPISQETTDKLNMLADKAAPK